MRHGRRARELEGLSSFITRLLPNRALPGDDESEQVRFNQLNKNTGNRIRYVKVDAERGDEVDGEDIIKGYQVSKGHYIEITDEDLEVVSVESTRTIDIDIRAARGDRRPLQHPPLLHRPGRQGRGRCLRHDPGGNRGHGQGGTWASRADYARARHRAGAARQGIDGDALRYPYEVRDEADYFEDIPNIKVEKEMLDLAKHIVQTKSGHFEPDKFEDRYETAVREVIDRKAKGEKIEVKRPERPRT